MYTSKYIHRNPLVFLKEKELPTSPLTSFGDYVRGTNPEHLEKAPILDFFPEKSKYQDFVLETESSSESELRQDIEASLNIPTPEVGTQA